MPTLFELRKQVSDMKKAQANAQEYRKLQAERQQLIGSMRRDNWSARHQTASKVVSNARPVAQSLFSAGKAGLSAMDSFMGYKKKK